MASRQSKAKAVSKSHQTPIATPALDESKLIQFPESDFILYQPFLPAGDQPTAIAGLIEGINDGLSYQTLLGVTGLVKRIRWPMLLPRWGAQQLFLLRIKP